MPSDVVVHMNSLADRDARTWAELDFEDDPSPAEEENPSTKVSLEEPADPENDKTPVLVDDIGISDNDEEEQYDGYEQLASVGVEPTHPVLTKVSTEPPKITASEGEAAPTRYNLRSRTSGTRTRFDLRGAIVQTTPVDIAFHMTISQAMKENPVESLNAMIQELGAMLRLKVWSPTLRSLVPKGQRIIRSSMFMKKKHDAAGAFLRWKARLVAGGDQQDKHHYDIDSELSSPTISMTALFILACIAVYHGWTVSTIDFASAFLHAHLKQSVYMMLNPLIASLLVRLDPSTSEYVQEDGFLIVCLIRALYGCVESGKLWYDLLSSSLIELGFVMNWYDRCVFNKGKGDKMILSKLQSTVNDFYAQ